MAIPIETIKQWFWFVSDFPKLVAALHLEMWSIMGNGADENQGHRCDPYGLRVQEQPLFLVCSSITIFTPYGPSPTDGADQK